MWLLIQHRKPSWRPVFSDTSLLTTEILRLFPRLLHQQVHRRRMKTWKRRSLTWMINQRKRGSLAVASHLLSVGTSGAFQAWLSAISSDVDVLTLRFLLHPLPPSRSWWKRAKTFVGYYLGINVYWLRKNTQLWSTIFQYRVILIICCSMYWTPSTNMYLFGTKSSVS